MSAVLRRKNVKKGISFTIMVVGKSGVGKSSFINTLVETELIPMAQTKSYSEKQMAIKTYQIEVEEGGVKINLSIIDTPGYGDYIDNQSNFDVILNYVKQQFDEVLLEESRIKRNPKFQDNRVDVCLYFLQPTGHSLKKIDLEFLHRLSQFVNIIPIIGKSDTLQPDELHRMKKTVMRDLKHLKLNVFQFPYDPEEDSPEVIQENEELRSLLPFAIVTNEGTFEVNGRKVRGRKYPWGIVEVDNAKHCDFSRLRYVLFTSHLQDLNEYTHDVLYENYRTLKLSVEERRIAESMPASGGNVDGSMASANPAEMSSADLSKHVWLKEELLKGQEEKLREMEIKMQKELEVRRRELLMKEQSLKELEQKLERGE